MLVLLLRAADGQFLVLNPQEIYSGYEGSFHMTRRG